MSHAEQDESNAAGPVHTFVAALPPHVARAFHANGNSIPQLRALAEAGVDLKQLAKDVSYKLDGKPYRSPAEIHRIVTFRIEVAYTRDANPSANTQDSSS